MCHGCHLIFIDKNHLNSPTVIERETVTEGPSDKSQQVMAAPNGHVTPLRPGTGDSPTFQRRSPALGMNGSLVNGSALTGNGIGMNGGIPNAESFVAKHDESHFLANLLADERKRCNQHKENYSALKQEHRTLVSVTHRQRGAGDPRVPWSASPRQMMLCR